MFIIKYYKKKQRYINETIKNSKPNNSLTTDI